MLSLISVKLKQFPVNKVCLHLVSFLKLTKLCQTCSMFKCCFVTVHTHGCLLLLLLHCLCGKFSTFVPPTVEQRNSMNLAAGMWVQVKDEASCVWVSVCGSSELPYTEPEMTAVWHLQWKHYSTTNSQYHINTTVLHTHSTTSILHYYTLTAPYHYYTLIVPHQYYTLIVPHHYYTTTHSQHHIITTHS